MTRALTVALALAVALAPVGPAPPARAGDVVIEDAQVVSPSGSRIRAGGSATGFSIRLPDGASCPGSTVHEGWLVNSYMVRHEVDPATVTYDGLGPTPLRSGGADFRQPLFRVDSRPYASAPTEEVDRPGLPGRVIDVPAFDFAVIPPGEMPEGRYHLGIACTHLNEVARIWDAEIEVREEPTDDPGHISWRVVDAPGSSGGRGTPLAPLAGAAVAVVAVVAVRRRFASAPSRAPQERVG